MGNKIVPPKGASALSRMTPAPLQTIARFPNPLPAANPSQAQPSAAVPFVNIYDPPMAVLQAPPPITSAQGIANGYEVGTVQLNTQQIPSVLEKSVAVYSTSKRWEGCDVYVSTDFVSGSNLGWICVQVYAVSKNAGRSLVATGRTRSTNPGAVRIASARAVCDSYDVVVSKSGGPLDPSMKATITVVASDECDQNDGDQFRFTGGGAISVYPDTMIGFPTIQALASTAVPAELVAVHAVNANAARRWLQVWDDPAFLTGLRYSFLVEPGASLFVDGVSLGATRFVQGIAAGPSTAADSYVAPGGADFRYTVIFR